MGYVGEGEDGTVVVKEPQDGIWTAKRHLDVDLRDRGVGLIMNCEWLWRDGGVIGGEGVPEGIVRERSREDEGGEVLGAVELNGDEGIAVDDGIGSVER